MNKFQPVTLSEAKGLYGRRKDASARTARLSMTAIVCFLFLVLTACAPATAVPANATPSAPQHLRLVGYFASWDVYGRDYHVNRIPAEKLTHINYAFANISELGKCSLGDKDADISRYYYAGSSVSGEADGKDGYHGNFNQLRELKIKYPALQVLISIGGWTWSSKFSDVALTPESRQKFVASCIDLFLQQYAGVFDGIDIDWEYPVSGGLKDGRPEDKQNFTALLAEFRQQLDTLGTQDNKHYLLTIAAPAGPAQIANLELDQIHTSLDWINVMAYDFHVASEPTTNLNAPLYASAADENKSFNGDAAIQAYLKGGVPADKLVLGIPFYRHAWEGVAADNHGLAQAATGPAKGVWDSGFFDYKEIKAFHLATAERYWQDQAQVPWLYEPKTGVFISYDDPESLQKKSEYIKAQHLGGAMFWEASLDGGELVDVLYQNLIVGH